MAESTLHDIPSAYEPSLFGTYSKKIGMWLFLLSDSLTFGALLYAYSYGRISNRRAETATSRFSWSRYRTATAHKPTGCRAAWIQPCVRPPGQKRTVSWQTPANTKCKSTARP